MHKRLQVKRWFPLSVVQDLAEGLLLTFPKQLTVGVNDDDVQYEIYGVILQDAYERYSSMLINI